MSLPGRSTLPPQDLERKQSDFPEPRYRRMLGEDVFFMTGADEHGSSSQLFTLGRSNQ